MTFYDKTFGALTRQYFWRQLFFSALIGGFFVLFLVNVPPEKMALQVKVFNIGGTIVSTLLYPYSKFVYDGIVSFIVGNNTFLLDLRLMFFIKLFGMLFCFCFAIFVAPVGLAYLYWKNSRPV